MCKKNERKMSSDEVQGLLTMRKRNFRIDNKKGKGSYRRQENKKIERDY